MSRGPGHVERAIEALLQRTQQQSEKKVLRMIDFIREAYPGIKNKDIATTHHHSVSRALHNVAARNGWHVYEIRGNMNSVMIVEENFDDGLTDQERRDYARGILQLIPPYVTVKKTTKTQKV